jgi:uncharacterized flavoprotein (TIGR03862 family)
LPSVPDRVAIIGAGPAGLMAAEILAAAGVSVTLFERMPTAARKFLMAGRGGLNLTHSEPLEKFLTRYGTAREFLTPYIEKFTPDDLCAWCKALGQETYVGSSGRVFPKTMKASPLLRSWLLRLHQSGVVIHYNRTWTGWNGEGLTFDDGQPFKADAVLLALGGASWPKLGSDGGWVGILSSKDVAITPLRPANCGFNVPWSPIFRAKFAGQPVKPVVLSCGGQNVQGEIMLTEKGIEGGAVYALSSYIRKEIEAKGKTVVTLDLRPDISLLDLQTRLKKPRGRDSMSNHLRKTGGLSPTAIGLVNEILHQRKGADPAVLTKALPLTLTGTTGIERAISSAGGIALDEVTPDFMLKKMPGIFVAGEMLDWEAPTGGYLLQATFSTAVQAANGILAFLRADSRT